LRGCGFDAYRFALQNLQRDHLQFDTLLHGQLEQTCRKFLLFRSDILHIDIGNVNAVQDDRICISNSLTSYGPSRHFDPRNRNLHWIRFACSKYERLGKVDQLH
jgi:hypothetical protein